MSRNTCPGCVPAGRVTVDDPWMVSISISAPSTASITETVTDDFRSAPSRSKRGSGFTRTVTYRSPAACPRSPASPWPCNRSCCPSSMPAGMSTETVSVFDVRPSPLHSLHGVSGIDPEPWQSPQTVRCCTEPKIDCATRVTCPVPPHVLHVVIFEPFAAPLPPHVSHERTRVSRSCTGFFSSVSFNSISTATVRSWPCVRLRPPRPPPKKFSNKSPMSPMSPMFPWNPWKPEKSNPPGPPACPLVRPNWSYMFFFWGSFNVSYASFISLNFASAFLSPLCLSGCHSLLRRLYAFLISSAEADVETPRTE